MSKTQKSHSSTAKSIQVQPGSLEKFELGTFTDKGKIPEYQFDFMPDLPDIMGVQQLLMETDDGVCAIYHFQNYGQQTVTVLPRKKIA